MSIILAKHSQSHFFLIQLSNEQRILMMKRARERFKNLIESFLRKLPVFHCSDFLWLKNKMLFRFLEDDNDEESRLKLKEGTPLKGCPPLVAVLIYASRLTSFFLKAWFQLLKLFFSFFLRTHTRCEEETSFTSQYYFLRSEKRSSVTSKICCIYAKNCCVLWKI